MRLLGRILLGTLATLGLLVVVLIAAGVFVASRFDIGPTARTAPDKFVLTLVLDGRIEESTQRPALGAFNLQDKISMQEAILALRRAKDDPRVTAVAANLIEHGMGLAQVQEIREAIGAIRAAGKPTLVFADTIGEGDGALASYYLASAFEKVWVQPSGMVGVAGIGVEQPFVKAALDRLGLKASVVQRKDYKSAAENFTRNDISPANKEQLTALVGSWYTSIVDGIAAARKLDPAAVKALVDKGPLMAPEAVEAGLVDELGYRDQFRSELQRIAGNVEHVPLRRYIDMAPWREHTGPIRTIALVSAVGTITRGGPSDNPLVADEGIKAEVTAKAIRDAVANDRVEAIVLRVDSPGGSYVASDTIWREVMRAKWASKPVIVSMGNTAASGGYYIAMAADRIFASPGTITGSIGVLTGKMVVAGASEKLDVKWDRIAFGESAGMFSSTTDFNQAELARLNTHMDAIYTDFTTKAAQGRGKPVEEFEKVARGRVWSGVDAVQMGLVDELGGLSAAIDHAKTRIGLKPEDSARLVLYPEPQDSLDAILKAMGDDRVPSDIMSGLRALASLGALLRPMMQSLHGVNANGPQLYMDPIVVE